jgi:hypothetical protein
MLLTSDGRKFSIEEKTEMEIPKTTRLHPPLIQVPITITECFLGY